MERAAYTFTKEKATIVKSVAVTLMVFHHLFRIPNLYKNFNVCFFHFSEKFANELFSYFKLCVGMFAFVSGYGLCKSWKTMSASGGDSELVRQYGSFVKKRYIKTMSDYWFVFVLSLVICELLNHRTNTAYFVDSSRLLGITNIIISFLGMSSVLQTPQLSAEWWYISANIVYIVLTPLLYLFLKNGGKSLSLLAL